MQKQTRLDPPTPEEIEQAIITCLLRFAAHGRALRVARQTQMAASRIQKPLTVSSHSYTDNQVGAAAEAQV